jgi:hypothetical protein
MADVLFARKFKLLWLVGAVVAVVIRNEFLTVVEYSKLSANVSTSQELHATLSPIKFRHLSKFIRKEGKCVFLHATNYTT